MSGTSHVEPTTFTAAWGGVTLCIVMSAVLNGSITMQTYSYFHKFFHKDRLLLKYAIGIIWLGSTFHFVCEYWIMHDIIVVGYHLPFDEVTIPIGFSIALAVQSIVHCLVQGVYISRMFRFSHNIWVLVSCCVLVALELGLGLAWGGRVAHTAIARQANAWNEESRWMITTFFTVSMVVDMIITASMCYQLMRSRTMGLKRTRHLVDKLIRWTIQTGMLTSAVSIAIVLTENLKQDSYLWVGICAIVSDCYATGLLALLNARTSLEELNTDHVGLPMATTSLVWAKTFRSTGILSTTIGKTSDSEPCEP